MKKVSIFEVGPRDGLQALQYPISFDEKVELVAALAKSGLTDIEVGAFVHPKLVPNMAESDGVYAAVAGFDADMSVLVPNKRGVDRAKLVNAYLFNIFYSPNEVFNMSNYGRTLDAIVEEYKLALEGIDPSNVRVYISMAFDCPDEDLRNAVEIAMQFGNKVVLCDTDGIATPVMIKKAYDITSEITENIAIHLHHGPYLYQNVDIAVDLGIKEFDTSIGGLGGCPFIPGSGANLATEVFVKWCEARDIDCGVKSKDLKDAVRLATWIKNKPRGMKMRRAVRAIKNKGGEVIDRIR